MTIRQALAPLLKNHRPVVARSFSAQTMKETILYLKTEIASIKQVQAQLRLQAKKAKADGKSFAHIERALKRQDVELGRFETRLADFKTRQAAAESKQSNSPPKAKIAVAPTPKPAPSRPARRAVAKP